MILKNGRSVIFVACGQADGFGQSSSVFKALLEKSLQGIHVCPSVPLRRERHYSALCNIKIETNLNFYFVVLKNW